MSSQSQDMDEKQNQFFEKARKGVLKFLLDQGGKLNMGQLHEHSMTKYFIQHQGFSRMMETFVDQGLVDYDYATQEVTLSELGREFVNAPVGQTPAAGQ